MSVLFSNSASTTLSAGVGDSATSITVADGSVFPAITGSDYFYLTLEVDSDPELKEIVKCTARSGNTLTIARGQDSTSARTFSTADKAELRLTAAGLNDVATQADTDTTYSVQDGELSENNFTNADHTKLDGIAASANNYSHPSAHAISFITGLQSALDGKVDDSQVLTNVPSGALFTDTNTTYSVGDGGLSQINFTSADHTKLNGIEASATADQTAAQILTAIKTVDGAGSGLDADLLDGATSSVFLKSPSNVSGWLTNDRNFRVRSGGTAAGFLMEESDGTFGFQIYGDSGQYGFLDAAWGNWDIQKVVNSTFKVDEGSGLVRVWNAGNDGSGSGLDADLLDGLQLHTGRNHEANKVVRTNSNGYIDAGWINTTSGDSGIVNDVARIYCSNDGYLRYLGKSEFKVLMGLSKSTYDRRDSTSNSHYWQGANGYGAIDMNTLFLNYGSGAIDTWSSPANQPSGSSHWVGQQMLHYSTGSVGHGWQLVMGAGNPSLIYARGTWGGAFTSWAKMWNSTNDGSGSGLDADTCDGQHLGTSAAVQFGSVTSSGNVTAYSDRRIKENITPITEALSKVQSLTGNTYTRNDQEDTVTRYAGLIAQEVEQVLPEAVKENDDGIKALDYNATIALLVESIKELKAEVDDLKTRLENK
jgi:hypothetical protein